MTDSTAASSTELMRTSDDPLFRRLRDLLAERGVDVETSALAELFPDEADQEVGVVVGADRRVHLLVLHYGTHGNLKAQAAAAVLAGWSDISDGWETTPHARNVRDALDLLDAG